MINLEILQLHGARFVSIPRGLKSPKNHDWHKSPKTIQELDIVNENVGIILNSSSNGLVAIDFDGESSKEFFRKTFNIEIPETVSFTSTREGRHQRLFKISSEYFDYLSLKQLKTGVIDSDGKHEQLELRFQKDKAAQSVLPPSYVKDDKGERTYQYLEGLSPSEIDICELPEEILVHWLKLCNDLEEREVEKVELPHTEDMVVHLAETLKQYYPTLSYDEWIRVAWGFKHSVGDIVALDLLRYFWPEKEKGEYRRLMRSQSSGRKCTLGTIRYMIKQKGGKCANTQEELDMVKLLNKYKSRRH